MKLTFINLIVVDAYLKIKHSLNSRYSYVHNNILSVLFIYIELDLGYSDFKLQFGWMAFS